MKKLVRGQVKAVEDMENAAKKKGKIPKIPEEPYEGI